MWAACASATSVMATNGRACVVGLVWAGRPHWSSGPYVVRDAHDLVAVGVRRLEKQRRLADPRPPQPRNPRRRNDGVGIHCGLRGLGRRADPVPFEGKRVVAAADGVAVGEEPRIPRDRVGDEHVRIAAGRELAVDTPAEGHRLERRARDRDLLDLRGAVGVHRRLAGDPRHGLAGDSAAADRVVRAMS